MGPYYLIIRHACSIQMEDTVVLTGGEDTMTQVSVYNSEGWVEDWAQLQTGRYQHACGHFVNTDNQVVRKQLSLLTIFTRAYLITMSRCTSWQGGGGLAPPTSTPPSS